MRSVSLAGWLACYDSENVPRIVETTLIRNYISESDRNRNLCRGSLLCACENAVKSNPHVAFSMDGAFEKVEAARPRPVPQLFWQSDSIIEYRYFGVDFLSITSVCCLPEPITRKRCLIPKKDPDRISV